MTDDQFSNLQILATYFDWFKDIFDRLQRDGKELQWRLLCEHNQPEIQVQFLCESHILYFYSR